MRKLKDGTEIEDLKDAVVLKIETTCPSKWLLVDRETGEAYVPQEVAGNMQWKKMYNAEWDVNA